MLYNFLCLFFNYLYTSSISMQINIFGDIILLSNCLDRTKRSIKTVCTIAHAEVDDNLFCFIIVI